MNLVEVVILVGSQCLSPMQSGPGLTEVNKVSCAVLVRQDPQTAQVEIVPHAAATDPDVIAMLVKPRPPGEAGSSVQEVPASDVDMTGSIDAPRQVPTSAEVVPKRSVKTRVAAVEPAPKPIEPKAKPKRVEKPVAKKQTDETASLTVTRKSAAPHARTDSCGSYKAVWYTNKENRRKYHCVKAS